MHSVETFKTLCPSLTLRDQVLHMYKTKDKIIFVYFSVYVLRLQIGRKEILD